jgi:hypothetical protein
MYTSNVYSLKGKSRSCGNSGADVVCISLKYLGDIEAYGDRRVFSVAVGNCRDVKRLDYMRRVSFSVITVKICAERRCYLKL